MNDRVLVEALRAGDPDALAALYDAYAEGIYRYCWSLLPHSDSAQVALRDTLIAAAEHAGSLSDPGRLRTWLYALAHAECLRRRLAAGRPDAAAPADAPGMSVAGPGWPADEPSFPADPSFRADPSLPGEPPFPGEPSFRDEWSFPAQRAFPAEPPAAGEPPGDPADADLRVMAANAVRGLPVADRAVLELTTRHGLTVPEVAAVLGVRQRQVEAARAQARDRLRDAITAEVLARKGPYDCATRARILSGFAGELTPRMREQLVWHLSRCETCAPHRDRPVSESKVFDLVPPVPLPAALRVRVLSCFADPELMPYRRYVARRSGALGPDGFPEPGDRRPRRWPQALAGTLAAVASMVAIAAVFHQFQGDLHQGGGTQAALPATAGPPGARMPWPPAPDGRPVDVKPIVEPIVDSRATFPYGMFHSITPVEPAPTAAIVPTQGVPTQGSLPSSTSATGAPATPSSSPGRPTRDPGTPVTPPPPGTPADPGGREHQSHGPAPTPCPTGKPTAAPTGKPTGKPTGRPTGKPTGDPTGHPVPSQVSSPPADPHPTPVPAPTPPLAATPVPTDAQPPTPSSSATA
ncbi:hypothetical protein GCM10010149_58460 [Nonomuraea roseoviolacea subsp. roseoviolacea]|uniref:RNA polymerase sigma factor n=1 Tax=Nonomuraea roseoviolacea TaxID=103837 RepID=UPI0031D3CFFB